MTKFSKVIDDKIYDRDKKHLDPDQRSEFVNTFIFHALGLEDPKAFISQPLYWDLLCYCNGMLLLYAMSVQDETLLKLMKLVNNHIHSLHYSVPDSHPTLGPSKEEHERLWQDRIDTYF